MDGFAFVQMIETELKQRGISKEKFYAESGISSATMSQWRKGIYSPSSAAIKKIENYFGITLSIERKGLMAAQVPYVPIDEERLQRAVQRALKETAPIEPERQISDDDIKFALFGGDGEITDAMYDEVKRFAQMVKLREEAAKKKE